MQKDSIAIVYRASIRPLFSARLLPLFAGLLTVGIFIFDTFSPVGAAAAVLYVAVVLLSVNFLSWRGVLLVSLTCAALAILGYVLQHGLIGDDAAVLRLFVSLSAIFITAILAAQGRSVAMVLGQKAQLLDLTHDTVFVRDMNDRITYWNRGAAQLYGWSAGEATGKVSHELTKTVFPQPLDEINHELLRTGRWEGELIHSKRDGTRVVVASRWSLQRNAQGRPLAVLETNNDVSAGKQAEESLLESEQRWRAIFEHNPTMYFMVDAAGTVLSVNPFGANQLGYEVDELVGQPVLKVFVEADRDAARRNVAACLDNLGTTLRWELRKERKDGTVMWVGETAKAVLLRDAPVVLIVCEDISKRKHAEEELRKTELQLGTVIANTPIVLFSVDRAGIFTLSEGKGLETVGLKGGEVVGRSVYDVYAGTPDVTSNIRRALSGTAFAGEVEVNDRLLETYYIPVFDANGVVDGVNGVAVDVTERRDAERKLRRSEAYLAEAQRLSHTGSFGWHVASNEIFWSEEGYRIFGYEPGSVVTLEMAADRIHPDDVPIMQGIIDAAIAGGRNFDAQQRLLMPDGTLKYVQLVGHAVHDEAGSLEFIGSMVDITAAKEAEKKIQRTIDTVPAFIWTTHADGSLDFISQRCLDYDGLTLQKSIKLGWGAQVHPDDREDSRAKWDAARTSGTHFEAEARFRRFDGEYRWFLSRAYPLVDHAGQILGWYGNDTDIHDRKLAEQKLAQSEAFLAEAQRLSKTGSFSRNVATGDLVWSEEMFRLFEYDPATTPTIDLVLGRIHPDDKQFMRQIIAGAADGTPELDEEYRLLMPDGSVKYMRNLRVAAQAQAQGDGGLTVVGTVMDVTERKLAEEALRKAQLELAHVARVTTFGEFAASIAHEVNQPLAAIVTNGEVCLRLLGRDPPDLIEVRQATEDVIRDGRRASEIIRRLRALTKKTEPEKLPLDINDVITGVIPLVRQEMLINRVWLRLELTPNLPRIRGDRVQLEQVIVNLVANAIDAMASVTEGPRELVISSRQDERDRAVISVRDSGQGIDPGIAGRLFDAFFTTKPSGMGMGLSICRSIIENHGGSLSASSNDGQLGATFRFTLPLVEEAVH